MATKAALDTETLLAELRALTSTPTRQHTPSSSPALALSPAISHSPSIPPPAYSFSIPPPASSSPSVGGRGAGGAGAALGHLPSLASNRTRGVAELSSFDHLYADILNTIGANDRTLEEHQKTQKEIKAVENEVDEIKQKLLNNKISTEETKAELSKKEKQLQERLEIEKLKQEMEISILKKKIDEMNKEGQKETAERKRLREELERAEEENKKMQLFRKELQDELDRLRARLEEENRVKRELEQKAKAKEQELAMLNETHRKKVEQLRKELLDAIAKEQQLREENDAAQAQAASLRTTVAKKEKKVTHTKKLVDNEKQLLKDARKEEEHSRTRVEEKKSLLEIQLQHTIAVASNHKTRVKKSKQVKEAERKAEEEIRIVENAREDIRDEIAIDDSEIEHNERTLKGVKDTNRDLTDQSIELDTSIDSQREETAATVTALEETAQRNLRFQMNKHQRAKARAGIAQQAALADVSNSEAAAEAALRSVESNTTAALEMRDKINTMATQTSQDSAESRTLAQTNKHLTTQLQDITRSIEATKHSISSKSKSIKKSGLKTKNVKTNVETNKREAENLASTAAVVQADISSVTETIAQQDSIKRKLVDTAETLQSEIFEAKDEIEAVKTRTEEQVTEIKRNAMAEKARLATKSAIEISAENRALEQQRQSAVALERDIVDARKLQEQARRDAEANIAAGRALEIQASIAENKRDAIERKTETIETESAVKAREAEFLQKRLEALENENMQLDAKTKNTLGQANYVSSAGSSHVLTRLQEQYNSTLVMEEANRAAAKIREDAQKAAKGILDEKSDSDEEFTEVMANGKVEHSRIRENARKARNVELTRQMELDEQIALQSRRLREEEERAHKLRDEALRAQKMAAISKSNS
ncbi:hypothetical protein Pelo_14742 [Pelomyxa schiedti]|nr:hypothetical protein Pelo_14742 [Pelomyxa schiedti]